MYLDDNHLFLKKEELQAFSGGVVGKVLDVGSADRLGEGHPFYMFIACGSDTTATGDPTIKVFMESADDEAFTLNLVSFQMFPDLKKGDLSGGKGLFSNPCPFRTRRYLRLNIETDIQIACTSLTAGLVINTQTNFAQV